MMLQKRIHGIVMLMVGLHFGVHTADAQTTTHELLVSSRNTSSVKRFNGQTGAYLGDVVQSGSGGLSLTQEVVIGPDGNLLVSGRGNTHVLKFDGVTGAYIDTFSTGYLLDNPTKMTIGPDGNLYISQWGTARNKVARFNAATGAFIDEFTSVGLTAGGGHAWDLHGNLYVANFGNGANGNVQKFDSTGQFAGVFTATGHLSGPINVWFGDDNDLFVVDWTRGAVVRFDGTNGTFKSDFITGLQNAEGFTVGPDSLFYICDWTANVVRKYARSGAPLGVFASDGNMQSPNSLLFRPSPAASVGTGKTEPGTFLLHQNFPNPFNPSTSIHYHLTREGHVSLVVYDILGRVVATLVHERQLPGSHEATFTPTVVTASGVFYYRMNQNGNTSTRAMIFMK